VGRVKDKLFDGKELEDLQDWKEFIPTYVRNGNQLEKQQVITISNNSGPLTLPANMTIDATIFDSLMCDCSKCKKSILKQQCISYKGPKFIRYICIGCQRDKEFKRALDTYLGYRRSRISR
jgi:hypothetical protein